MGTSGLEPPTSRLSGVRSNHLSYAPKLNNLVKIEQKFKAGDENRTRDNSLEGCSFTTKLHPLKWELTGSNRWPSACKADALPAELNSLELSDFHISQGATPNYFRRSRA